MSQGTQRLAGQLRFESHCLCFTAVLYTEIVLHFCSPLFMLDRLCRCNATSACVFAVDGVDNITLCYKVWICSQLAFRSSSVRETTGSVPVGPSVSTMIAQTGHAFQNRRRSLIYVVLETVCSRIYRYHNQPSSDSTPGYGATYCALTSLSAPSSSSSSNRSVYLSSFLFLGPATTSAL